MKKREFIKFGGLAAGALNCRMHRIPGRRTSNEEIGKKTGQLCPETQFQTV